MVLLMARLEHTPVQMARIVGMEMGATVFIAELAVILLAVAVVLGNLLAHPVLVVVSWAGVVAAAQRGIQRGQRELEATGVFLTLAVPPAAPPLLHVQAAAVVEVEAVLTTLFPTATAVAGEEVQDFLEKVHPEQVVLLAVLAAVAAVAVEVAGMRVQPPPVESGAVAVIMVRVAVVMVIIAFAIFLRGPLAQFVLYGPETLVNSHQLVLEHLNESLYSN
jgi:hypothetical protein